MRNRPDFESVYGWEKFSGQAEQQIISLSDRETETLYHGSDEDAANLTMQLIEANRIGEAALEHIGDVRATIANRNK